MTRAGAEWGEAMTKQEHSIAPVFDATSRVLILGSFPSVRSRETGFFYGHPQNRFWRVLAAIFHTCTPETNAEKRTFLLKHHVAVWDVIASCSIVGSSDTSIRDVVPTDLLRILNSAPIERIYVNGKTAERYYKRYQQPRAGKAAICLPSTSPANAAWDLEKLIDAWRIIVT